jgi:hypothetical protein
MLKSSIRVDLPGVETQRDHTPLEWLRALFGAQIDLRSGKEELTVGAFSLIEGLVAGFGQAGVHDVLSFLVDRRVVYIDRNEVTHDLQLIARAAQAAGVMDRKFKEMHLVLTHRDELLHTLIDCKVVREVLLGEAELQLQLSSRVPALQIQRGESAANYAERVQEFAARPSAFEPARFLLEQLTERIAAALQRTLVGAVVKHEPASVQLIRPEREQIGRFAKLPFGDQVLAPEYRPVPTLHRSGPYADPFYYYYYDPYYDFFNYMLITSMLQHSLWQSHHVQVVSPSGTPLFSGEQAAQHAQDSWIGRDAVSFDDAGQLELTQSKSWLPDADTTAEQQRRLGWFTGSTGSSCGSYSYSGSSSSDHGSSSSGSSSSCGSSSSADSGSSCGSSCGGGSSCGSSCGGGGGD